MLLPVWSSSSFPSLSYFDCWQYLSIALAMKIANMICVGFHIRLWKPKKVRKKWPCALLNNREKSWIYIFSMKCTKNTQWCKRFFNPQLWELIQMEKLIYIHKNILVCKRWFDAVMLSLETFDERRQRPIDIRISNSNSFRFFNRFYIHSIGWKMRKTGRKKNRVKTCVSLTLSIVCLKFCCRFVGTFKIIAEWSNRKLTNLSASSLLCTSSMLLSMHGDNLLNI